MSVAAARYRESPHAHSPGENYTRPYVWRLIYVTYSTCNCLRENTSSLHANAPSVFSIDRSVLAGLAPLPLRISSSSRRPSLDFSSLYPSLFLHRLPRDEKIGEEEATLHDKIDSALWNFWENGFDRLMRSRWRWTMTESYKIDNDVLFRWIVGKVYSERKEGEKTK